MSLLYRYCLQRHKVDAVQTVESSGSGGPVCISLMQILHIRNSHGSAEFSYLTAGFYITLDVELISVVLRWAWGGGGAS